ncbi:unnamed protein product [Lepeophtheirus salmonis]|uniref:(salmon louse) hypothetical protein n=1 Tax=Lepeophtheirus salmonis TaxID=72036 RepID=A0A7R8D3M2_LEPSM|nr:unnamed protein product [Lepeophtheirus salmonis]CAF3018395.1 unnamed protein product [Lepeophtheirus salmonis]
MFSTGNIYFTGILEASQHATSEVGQPSTSSPSNIPQKKLYASRPSETPRPSQPQTDVVNEDDEQLPLHCDKQGRCNLCPKGVPRWKYQKCMVSLCLNANQLYSVPDHQK